MTKHTPAPVIDVTEIFPFLAGREKTTVRLHPRRSSDLPINSSKFGGHFLWPDNEPWPVCSIPEIALIDDYDWSRPDHDICPVSHPKHNDAYIGVLQLKASDFPQMEFPAGKDLFQFLWCPRDHVFSCGWVPACKAYWRREQGISNPLLEIPKPSFVEDYYVPNLCSFNPEPVIEYPIAGRFSADTLSEEESLVIENWEKQKKLNQGFYDTFFSVAPGTKLGGYVNWIQYPEFPVCRCDKKMTHLLTIDSSEFDVDDYQRWCPMEDQALWETKDGNAVDAQDAAGLCIGDVGRMYVFVCQYCPDWPVEMTVQCG